MVDYETDVFISYRRSGHGQVRPWVVNHFHPLLLGYLSDQLVHQPRIFVDETIDTGEHWPDALTKVLKRSRLLVPVWSPPYFSSAWCQAEWQSMLLREELCDLGGARQPQGLVLPVIFADRENFPDRARHTQAVDLKRWNRPDPHFRTTPRYEGLLDAVETLAVTIARLLPRVPPWQDWPVRVPDPVDLPAPDLPVL